MPVCLDVCPLAYLNDMSQNFFVHHLWPWFSPPMTITELRFLWMMLCLQGHMACG